MKDSKKPSWLETLDMLGSILVNVICFNPDEAQSPSDY